MKKLFMLIIAFISFCNITLAKEIKVSFANDLKEIANIKAKKDEIIKVPIYYETKDFDLYAILADLEYDENHLELIDYKEENDFTVTMGKKILADRYEGDFASKGKIVNLNFKLKTDKKTNIKLTNIAVANTKEQLDLESVELIINANKTNVLFVIIPIILAGVGSYIILKNRKRR